MLSEASEIISLPELPNPAYSNATRYKAVTPRPWGLGPRGNTTAAGWETSPSLTSTELPQAWEAPSAGWASGDLPRASDETSATSNSRKPPPRPRWGRHRPVSRGIWGGQLSDERRVNAKKCILFFRPLQPPIEFNFSALRRYHRAADPSGGGWRKIGLRALGQAARGQSCAETDGQTPDSPTSSAAFSPRRRTQPSKEPRKIPPKPTKDLIPTWRHRYGRQGRAAKRQPPPSARRRRFPRRAFRSFSTGNQASVRHRRLTAGTAPPSAASRKDAAIFPAEKRRGRSLSPPEPPGSPRPGARSARRPPAPAWATAGSCCPLLSPRHTAGPPARPGRGRVAGGDRRMGRSAGIEAYLRRESSSVPGEWMTLYRLAPRFALPSFRGTAWAILR